MNGSMSATSTDLPSTSDAIRIDVETGIVRFNGSYDNPSLDILAIRPNIAVRAGVQVTNEELSQVLRQEASRYPGQERQVIDFYRQNPGALSKLQAPIYEEKVVDYILSKATVTDKSVTREELMKEVGDE